MVLAMGCSWTWSLILGTEGLGGVGGWVRGGIGAVGEGGRGKREKGGGGR